MVDETSQDRPSLRSTGGWETSSEQAQVGKLAAAGGLRPGDRIGIYTLLGEIGEGGFGVVYLAQQQRPLRRRVAVKVIKLGMDTRRVIARFEAERQALAMMDHPNVARVYDAGTTDSGRPYFVMEHVPGLAVTDHCDRHKLSIEDRLKLFVQVCDAVQHAHQKGIIHRDLKPSNVLVTLDQGTALTKVIDFGVAKAIGQSLTEKTMFTEEGQIVGTPQYMSPEQAAMTARDIDTRTDIYSLGVLLYELLTGTLPFDPTTFRGAGVGEIQRIIAQREPDKPSTRLGGANGRSRIHAARRRSDPKTLTRARRGDLDWITMRAMEKDRARRYETANGLAADIRRHLASEPVLAGPPGAGYRVGKFCRRHRIAVAAGVAAVAVLVVATAVSVAFAVREAEQRRAADAARQDLEVVAEFEARMIRSVDPRAFGLDLAQGLRRRVRDGLEKEKHPPGEIQRLLSALDDLLAHVNTTDLARDVIKQNFVIRSLEMIEREFADRPLIKASLLHTIAVNDYTLSDVAFAETPLAESLEIRRRLLGDEHPDTLAVWKDLANNRYWLGRLDEARADFEELLEISERTLGEEHEQTLSVMHLLANVYTTLGRYDDAELLYKALLEGRRRVLGELDPSTFWAMHNLGFIHELRYELAEAERVLTETFDLRKRTLGEEHRDTLWSMGALARVYVAQGRYDVAETLLDETLEIRRTTQGMEHDDTVGTLAMLAALYVERGRYGEAEALFVQVLASLRRALPDDGIGVIGIEQWLAKICISVGRHDDAGHILHRTLALSEDLLGGEHPRTLGLQCDLARLYGLIGRYADAESLHARTLEVRRRLYGDEHPDTASSLFGLAEVHLLQERPAEAEPLAAEAVRIVRRTLGDGHPIVGKYLAGLGESLIGLRRYPDAEAVLLESFDIVQPALGPDHDSTLRTVRDLLALYDAWAKPDRATACRGHLPDATPQQPRRGGRHDAGPKSSFLVFAYRLRPKPPYLGGEGSVHRDDGSRRARAG